VLNFNITARVRMMFYSNNSARSGCQYGGANRCGKVGAIVWAYPAGYRMQAAWIKIVCDMKLARQGYTHKSALQAFPIRIIKLTVSVQKRIKLVVAIEYSHSFDTALTCGLSPNIIVTANYLKTIPGVNFARKIHSVTK